MIDIVRFAFPCEAEHKVEPDRKLADASFSWPATSFPSGSKCTPVGFLIEMGVGHEKTNTIQIQMVFALAANRPVVPRTHCSMPAGTKMTPLARLRRGGSLGRHHRG